MKETDNENFYIFYLTLRGDGRRYLCFVDSGAPETNEKAVNTISVHGPHSAALSVAKLKGSTYGS